MEIVSILGDKWGEDFYLNYLQNSVCQRGVGRYSPLETPG